MKNHHAPFGMAVAAYARYCDRNGFVFQQPSETLSRVGRKIVRLCNVNGELARFVLKTRKIETP